MEKELDMTLRLMQDYFKEHRVRWALETDLSSPQCFLDPDQLRQILLNLFENAVQAMGLEEAVLHITLTNTVDSANQRWVKIVIADNGRGIGEEDFDQLFDPFFTRFDGGTGLGLSIVQRLMTENRGQIEFESKEGEGTAVTLLFEVYEDA